jgi:acetoin utilization protein AcuB
MTSRTIRSAMTEAPHTVEAEQPLVEAHDLMRSHHVRHLPVLRGGDLVGVVSQRDLFLIETLRDVDVRKVTVEEAMSSEPYTVGPDEPLERVLGAMRDHRYGSTVVVEAGHVIGIFTTSDALRLLHEILTHPAREPRPPPRGGRGAKGPHPA